MVITNAKILTMDGGAYYEDGYIHIRYGKIAAVGEMRDAPDDGDVLDADGGFVTPGLIDAHCHLGIFGDAAGIEGSDGNEETDPQTPHLRAIDAINPFDKCFEDARAAGVTCVVTGPGSANVLGGQTAAIKTGGRRIDDMIVKAPCSIKCAFGENPKAVYRGKNRAPVTRMATAALIRESLYTAMSYGERLANINSEKPCIDLKSEALLSLLGNHIPLHAHAHRADDIFTAVRIAREFGVDVKIVHGTEGHLIADELAKEGVDVMVGPCLGDRGKPELKNKTFETAALLRKAGVRVAIITDHPETPVNYLLLCARLAADNGMDDALRAVTCDAADISGIGDRVGRIKAGYDADLAIFDNNPMLFESKVKYTIIDGEKVYKHVASIL